MYIATVGNRRTIQGNFTKISLTSPRLPRVCRRYTQFVTGNRQIWRKRLAQQKPKVFFHFGLWACALFHVVWSVLLIRPTTLHIPVTDKYPFLSMYFCYFWITYTYFLLCFIFIFCYILFYCYWRRQQQHHSTAERQHWLCGCVWSNTSKQKP